jgi:hypothetical protein
MRGRVLVAALAAALVAVGVVASTSSAVPNPGQKIPQLLLVTNTAAVPAVGPLQFGSVPIGTEVVKPLFILNRTSEWMHYAGATWPNLQYPGAGVQPYPKGFWNVGGSGANFPCYDIAPRSSCTLSFGWQPFETGTHTATFTMTYHGLNSSTNYQSNVITMIGAGY